MKTQQNQLDFLNSRPLSHRRISLGSAPALAAMLAMLVLANTQRIYAGAGFEQSPILTKFVQDLRGVGPAGIPVAVPDGMREYSNGHVKADHYTIDINQFTDPLHPELPATTLW